MAEYVELTWPGSPNGMTRAERRPCSFSAYLPDTLTGRPIVLSTERAADIADTERRILQLNNAEQTFVGFEALARLLLRAEAVASSFIEGLRINVRRLAKADAAERAGWNDGRDETAQAVLGNIKAMDLALTLADADRPIEPADVLALHERLLTGTRDQRFGGVLRAEQNWVGGTGFTPCTAQYVPPPPDRVPALLDDLCVYLSGDEHPALMQAALAHAQFETIHPFVDGNGRTGRALIHVVLRRRGVASVFVPPISLVLATHADTYVAALTAYRYSGAPDSPAAVDGVAACVDRFVSDTTRACMYAERFGADLQQLEAQWRSRLGQPRPDSSVELLLRALPSAPVVTVNTAAELIGRSVQRTGDAVNRLVEAQVLRQITIGRRNRAFEAPDVIAAVTGFERALGSPSGDTRQAPPVRPVPYRR